MSYLSEVLEQPAVLARTLDGLADLPGEFHDLAQRLRGGSFTHLVASGMGSSYAATYPLLTFLNGHGITAFGADGGELLHYRQGLIRPDTVLLLVSQSGESVELTRLVASRRGRGFLVTLTNGLENTLARSADLALSFAAGPEKTVSTKTYTCALAALAVLAGGLAGDEQAALAAMVRESICAVEEFLADWQRPTQELVERLALREVVYLLGRGPSLASVWCGGLILKEGAHLAAEGMSAGEFRHGPLEAAHEGWPAIVFMPAGRTSALIARLVRDLLDLGVRVAVIGPESPDPRAIHARIRELPEWISPIAEIVPIQTLVHNLARAQGREPGQFNRMGKITATE